MHKQVIFFGAPGTGKSFEVDKITKSIPNHRKFRVTIHPEYLYTDFVGQLLPVLTPEGPTFDFKEGPFTLALKEAFSDRSKDVVLILEELSRGNVAAIFGDIFQLLDRDEQFNSRYSVKNKEVSDRIPELAANGEIYLPSNLSIICTVNTNDQNVYAMDTAFKRRFDWKYVKTDPVKDPKNPSVYLNNPILDIIGNTGSKNVEWVDFYKQLNRFISDSHFLGLGEDKQIGPFFINFDVSDQDMIKEQIQNKLLHYLWSDIHGASFKSDTRLFNDSIGSFAELYENYDNGKQIFSDDFISLL